MVFYQVFLLSPSQCAIHCNISTVETVRGCVSLKKKFISQGKGVEVTVNSKEKNSEETEILMNGPSGPWFKSGLFAVV
jgi:hypothetical protein